MGRLIDEDELIKDRVENDPVVIAAKCTPTAYDVDKVVGQLDAIKNTYDNSCIANAFQRGAYSGAKWMQKQSIEIVKGGGIE